MTNSQSSIDSEGRMKNVFVSAKEYFYFLKFLFGLTIDKQKEMHSHKQKWTTNSLSNPC